MAENENEGLIPGALMLLAGGVLGAGIALLLAPQSGCRTRRDLARYSKKFRKKAEGVVGEFSASVSEMVDSLGDKAEEILDKGESLAYESKQELLKALDEGQARLERQRARLTKIIG